MRNTRKELLTRRLDMFYRIMYHLSMLELHLRLMYQQSVFVSISNIGKIIPH
jgi:hypothetical protein